MGFIGKWVVAALAVMAVAADAASLRVSVSPEVKREGSMDVGRFGDGWRFMRYGFQPEGHRLDEPAGLERPDFDDSQWSPVSVPHDFAIAGPFRMDIAGNTGRLPYKGIGWYRKRFDVPVQDEGKRIWLDFDGVMANSQVWINGKAAGGWPYGYTSFRVDATPYIEFGKENVVAVRTDTEHWDSRWYPGAGMYRNVWLVKAPTLHVAYRSANVSAGPVAGADGKLPVMIDLKVANDGASASTARVSAGIYELDNADRIGRLISKIPAAKVRVESSDTAAVMLHAAVAGAEKWDIDHPVRYLARIEVAGSDGSVEHYAVPFGFRDMAVSREGLMLNGRPVKIKGVCNHHDLGALGAAVDVSAIRRQLEILKRMGCNSIRTSHNPPAPELLDLTDKMGFIVMVEAFDAWRTGKREWDYNKIFDDWHVRDLEAMVLRDRHHPSVMMWSVGNEVLEQRDSALTRHLADVVRSVDPTRPVTAGYNDPDGGRASGAAMGLDIMGVNYFFGEQGRWDSDPRYASMPTIGSETSSCVSSRGFYLPDGSARKDFQISSYDIDSPGWGCTPDVQFRTNAAYPHLLGEYVWTGFDYLGEPTPFNSDDTNLLNFRNDPDRREALEAELRKLRDNQPPSRSSYFGIVDLAGFPKDRYYLYQSHWNPDLPMAHIMPHWSWPGCEGDTIPVQVYTSGDEAELFVNGVSAGRRTKRPGQDFRMRWDDVVYTPGELKVVAYRDGDVWASDTVYTAGTPARLRAEAESPHLAPGDLAFVRISVTDSDGRIVPWADNEVEVAVEGDAVLRATDNGDATSLVPFPVNRRKAFAGLCLAIVAPDHSAGGRCRVKVSSRGLEPAYTDIHWSAGAEQ